MFKLILSDITWLDRNTKRQHVFIDEPKYSV
ncbi:hypothetical protein F383_10867 [Gossypium arboreum]|uniref:Uncharacterized protein n=1 Tax=Gossypium arboreum TaxID=29729 RepID=A0A0B0PT89_GOSAR|nr:hypothetical protein F383_10867 [Gossypium arboreum]